MLFNREKSIKHKKQLSKAEDFMDKNSLIKLAKYIIGVRKKEIQKEHESSIGENLFPFKSPIRKKIGILKC